MTDRIETIAPDKSHCALCGRRTWFRPESCGDPWEASLEISFRAARSVSFSNAFRDVVHICKDCVRPFCDDMGRLTAASSPFAVLASCARAARPAYLALPLPRAALHATPLWRRVAGWLGLLDAGARR